MKYRTVSELLCFQTCPSLWAARYYHNRGLRNEEPSALDVGSAFHEAMELQANQYRRTQFTYEEWRDSLQLKIEMAAQSRGYEPRDGDMRAADALALQAYDFWADPRRQDEDIIFNETPIEFPLTPNTRVRFKPDIVFENKHGLFHRQYKTIHSRAAVPDYVRLIKQSMHETIYRYGIVHETGAENYMGTDLVVFCKDAIHTRGKGAECSHCGKKGYVFKPPRYVQQPLRVTAEQMALKMRQIHHVNSQIETLEWKLDNGLKWNDPEVDPREHACYTRQRRLCWAFDACREKTVELSDDRLYMDIDPDARYKEQQSEDSRPED